MGDYHVHLYDHGPYRGVGPEPGTLPDGHIEAYVSAAAGRGVSEVGFTEHLYRCVESVPVLGEWWTTEPRADLAALTEQLVRDDMGLSLEGYVQAIVDAKDRGLPVLLGLEVDFFPETIGAVLELLSPYPWDFLIGSVHWLGGWTVDQEESSFECERRGVRKAYGDYFEKETMLAASGAVDVLAHVDLVKVAGHRLPEPPIDLYQKVVDAAAASGTAVEVSTSGLFKPVGEVYPAPTFLEMFHEAGVPITLASDAHFPEDCGREFGVAAAAARSAGYTEELRFSQRHRYAEPLGGQR